MLDSREGSDRGPYRPRRASDEDSDWTDLSKSPELRSILEKSRQQIREGKVLSSDEFWRQVEAGPSRLSEILDAAERRIDAGLGIDHDEFWRQVESESAADAS